ncbi:unnamed protein product [Closterium sp. Naga37s-1]|nr:unnamed protein product [Closterium sp. Naga37s-1]
MPLDSLPVGPPIHAPQGLHDPLIQASYSLSPGSLSLSCRPYASRSQHAPRHPSHSTAHTLPVARAHSAARRQIPTTRTHSAARRQIPATCKPPPSRTPHPAQTHLCVVPSRPIPFLHRPIPSPPHPVPPSSPPLFRAFLCRIGRWWVWLIVGGMAACCHHAALAATAPTAAAALPRLLPVSCLTCPPRMEVAASGRWGRGGRRQEWSVDAVHDAAGLACHCD